MSSTLVQYTIQRLNIYCLSYRTVTFRYVSLSLANQSNQTDAANYCITHLTQAEGSTGFTFHFNQNVRQRCAQELTNQTVLAYVQTSGVSISYAEDSNTVQRHDKWQRPFT